MRCFLSLLNIKADVESAGAPMEIELLHLALMDIGWKAGGSGFDLWQGLSSNSPPSAVIGFRPWYLIKSPDNKFWKM